MFRVTALQHFIALHIKFIRALPRLESDTGDVQDIIDGSLTVADDWTFDCCSLPRPNGGQIATAVASREAVATQMGHRANMLRSCTSTERNAACVIHLYIHLPQDTSVVVKVDA